MAVFAQVALCHEFSKFYAEEDERLTAVRAILERRLGMKLARLKIDNPAKRGRNSTTDGAAYCNEKVNIRPPISLAQLRFHNGIQLHCSALAPQHWRPNCKVVVDAACRRSGLTSGWRSSLRSAWGWQTPLQKVWDMSGGIHGSKTVQIFSCQH